MRAGDPNTYKLARSPDWDAYTPQKGAAETVRIVLQQELDSVASPGSLLRVHRERARRHGRDTPAVGRGRPRANKYGGGVVIDSVAPLHYLLTRARILAGAC